MEMETTTGMIVATPIAVSADSLTRAGDEHVLLFPDEYVDSNIISTSNDITVVGSHDIHVLGSIELPPLSQVHVDQGNNAPVNSSGQSGNSGPKTTASVGIQVNLCCCEHLECNLSSINAHTVQGAVDMYMTPQADKANYQNIDADVQENSECDLSEGKDADVRVGKSDHGKDLLVIATQKLMFKHGFNDVKGKEKKRRKADKPSAHRKPKQQKVLTRRSTKSTLERRYLCEGCGIRFVHKATYDRHLQELRGKAAENKCSFCVATFPFLCKLKQHIAAKHPELTSSPARERPVICHICGIQLQTSISMNKHMRIHDGDKPFLCKYCPKAFRWHTGLEYHERIHTGERPFKCPNCPKAFTNPSDMARHQTVHTGKKPHLCHQCGKGFTQSGTLNAHIKSKHTKLASSVNTSPAANLCVISTACTEPVTAPVNLKQPDMYVCHLCGKSFPQDQMLNVHIRKSHLQANPSMMLEGSLRCGTLEDMKLQLATCSALSQSQVFSMPSCVPTEREIAEVVVNMLAQ